MKYSVCLSSAVNGNIDAVVAVGKDLGLSTLDRYYLLYLLLNSLNIQSVVSLTVASEALRRLL